LFDFHGLEKLNELPPQQDSGTEQSDGSVEFDNGTVLIPGGHEKEKILIPDFHLSDAPANSGRGYGNLCCNFNFGF
jgi:hypothetical protein